MSKHSTRNRAKKAAESRWTKEKAEVSVKEEGASGLDILLENEDALYTKCAGLGLKGTGLP